MRAESERRVTSRPAPDDMAYVTVLLPMAQGVAVYASLWRAADTTFDDRSRGQVMADTLVERVTGRPADVPVPSRLTLSSPTKLSRRDSAPAQVPGYGPIPAAIACRLASDAIADERSKAALRRLYRRRSPVRW